MATKRNLLRGVLAEIELPDGARLLSGKAREELGELEGWAYLHTGISFWPTKNVTADRAPCRLGSARQGRQYGPTEGLA